MKKIKPIYWYQTSTYKTITNESQPHAYCATSRRYIPQLTFLVNNIPGLYVLEFRKLSWRHNGAYCKVLHAPDSNLIDMELMLDGDLFTDYIKTGRFTQQNQSLIFQDTLMIKNIGCFRLVRP